MYSDHCYLQPIVMTIVKLIVCHVYMMMENVYNNFRIVIKTFLNTSLMHINCPETNVALGFIV